MFILIFNDVHSKLVLRDVETSCINSRLINYLMKIAMKAYGMKQLQEQIFQLFVSQH